MIVEVCLWLTLKDTSGYTVGLNVKGKRLFLLEKYAASLRWNQIKYVIILDDTLIVLD